MTIRLLVGDCRATLATLPPDSISMCITSPPYFQLRRYLDPGDPLAALELGSEPTPESFIANLVDVFRAVRRVLHPTGTLWCNLGDSYAGSGKGKEGPNALIRHVERQGFDHGGRTQATGLPPKNLMLMPHRVAMALQADGWILRSAIVWAKKSPMPESVVDRPTSAYEMVFLLAKRDRYFYDSDAIREEAEYGYRSNFRSNRYVSGHAENNHDDNYQRNTVGGANPETGRNARNVWLLGPSGFHGAHFATFPPELARRCILAGSSARGVCPACLAPWRRVVEKPSGGTIGQSWHDHADDELTGNNKPTGGTVFKTYRRGDMLGWEPTCRCGAGEPIPATILDPFAGSGTALMVADRLGRDAIGCELNPEYARLAEDRITSDAPLFADLEVGA